MEGAMQKSFIWSEADFFSFVHFSFESFKRISKALTSNDYKSYIAIAERWMFLKWIRVIELVGNLRAEHLMLWICFK